MKPIIFADRDGVLVGTLGDFKGNNPAQYKEYSMPLILPVIEKLKDFEVLIISNQRGVSLGKTTLKRVVGQSIWLHSQLEVRGVAVQGTLFCPNNGESCWFVGAGSFANRTEQKTSHNLSFRKPEIGMGIFAETLTQFPLFYLGDLSGKPGYAPESHNPSMDKDFAENMGWRYKDVNDFLSR